MLNTLLDFFRLDNGKEQPKILPCRISAITHTLETEFMPIAMNKGLSLTVNNLSDTVVLTDKERIIQIGNNLLSNAIKFTENGGVSLTMDYDNGVLILVVEDTGTGMPEAVATTTGIVCELPTLDERRRSSSSKPFIPSCCRKSAIVVITDNTSKAYSNHPGVCGICSTHCLTSSVWTMARNSPKYYLAGYQQSHILLKRSLCQ